MGKLGQSRGRAVRLVTVAAAMAVRPVTLAWLREELGLYTQANPSTGRTQFERDKQDLQDAGVAVAVDGDSYRIERSHSQRFDDDELDALVAAGGLVADPKTGAALAAFAAHADAYPEVTRTDRVLATVPDAPRLVAAIEQRRAVRFRYRGANAPASDRHVEPWGLRARRGLWYVVGHDVDRGGHRHFRIDRIEGTVEPAGVASHDRPDPLPRDLLPNGAGPVRFRLGGRGHFDTRRLGGTLTSVAGTTVAAFSSLRDEAALGFALRHDATIAEPASLEDQRRLRAQFVHDRHTLPAPEVPTALAEEPRAEPALDAARLRRLLLLGGWLGQRVGVTLEETARGMGCSEDELREDIAVLQDVQLPGVGDVFDVAVEADGTIVHQIAVAVAVGIGALDRGRVRTLLEAAANVDDRAAAGYASLVDRLDTPSVVAVDPTEVDAELRLLRRARDERRTVRFSYLRRDGSVSRRRVTPTELAWVDGLAYLGGWDHDRGAGRTFRLDRLAELVVGDVDPVVREVPLSPPTYVPRGDEVEVVLRCSHVGDWVLTRLLPTRRHADTDGTVWAVVRTDMPQLVVDHVLVAAGEVEVVAPADLRDEVAERAAQVH